jgi:WD40 repeat protein
MLGCIGEGSYGQVWLARNVMGEPRAVKVVHRHKFREDDRAYEREFNGIRLYEPISRSHESLVPILHVGRDDRAGHFYYVMELADDAQDEGGAGGSEADRPLPDSASYVPKTLRGELKRRGRLPPEECVATGAALATALEQLHKNNLVHRDIKPSNIIFVHGRPKLADIGLVTDLDASLSFVGTMGYVAPEGPGTPATDIFALGKVFYEMATGRDRADFPALPAFDGMAETERKGVRELNAVVLKACAPAPAQRHRTAGELRDELLRLQVGESIERQRALERAYGSLKLAVRAIAAVLVVAALLVGVWFYQGRLALRESLLAQARLERIGILSAGWSTNNWRTIQRANAIRSGVDILAQASPHLTGLDAEPLHLFWQTAAGSAAFSPDGTALLGGILLRPTLLLLTNGTKRELPLRAQGPVCWTRENVPLQFSTNSNACILQEALTGEVRRLFPLTSNEVVNYSYGPVLAMTPNGDFVAAATAQDGRGRVVAWNTANGETLGEATFSATALTFSEDGSVLAAGDGQGNISVYSLPGFLHRLELKPPSGPNTIRCLALARNRVIRPGQSAKSQVLAAAYKGGELVIWDLHTRLPRAFCRGTMWAAASLAFHSDGMTLASGGRPEVRFWDLMTGQLLLRSAVVGAADCQALSFSSDGLRLAWGTAPGGATVGVGILKLQPHRGIHLLRGLATNSRGVWFSPDSRLLAALSDDWHVGIWETETGKLVHILEVPAGVLADSAGAAFSSNSLAFAFAAGTEARLYDVASGGTLSEWQLPKSGFYDHLQFNRAGKLLFVRRGVDAEPENERKWRLYELPLDGAPILLHEQTETNWVPYRTAFAAHGERFFVWNNDPAEERAVVRAYDVASGTELWQMPVPRCAQPIVRIDPTGQWFTYSRGLTNGASLLSLSDFKVVDDTAPHCHAIHPSGNQFAFPRDTGFVIGAQESPEGGLLIESDLWRGFEPSFSPDGKFIAWGTREGPVVLAEIETVRQKLASLRR